jgi:hypothetical protein
MPGQVRYWTKLTQSGIFLVWYRTKILDAGMPMPALVFLMPMPSYGYYTIRKKYFFPAHSPKNEAESQGNRGKREGNFLIIQGK